MHIGFQRLLNEFTDDTDLKYCDFGVPALSLKKPADLHHYVTHMFRNHFSAEQTLAPALHDGTVSWESLQTMSFAEFRALHSGLNIPVTADSDPLLALWNAFHYSSSRDVVFAAMHPLLNQGPPLEKFAAVIKSKQGNSSGCPSGLQYKHLQHWQPHMIADAYECLATMWQDRYIPAAWKWKWLVPIPKNTSKRIQDIRPIMLMEVRRKIWTGLLVDKVTYEKTRFWVITPEPTWSMRAK